MTKLVEWLAAAGIVVAIWLGLLTNTVENNLAKSHYTLLLLSPIIFVGLFGVSLIKFVKKPPRVTILRQFKSFLNCNTIFDTS